MEVATEMAAVMTDFVPEVLAVIKAVMTAEVGDGEVGVGDDGECDVRRTMN